MKTYAFCPISDRLINERVARINAAFTVLFLILFAFIGSPWLLAFMAIDFWLRGSSYSKYSLIGFSSKQIIRFLPVDVKLTNAGPKIFAARVGLLLSTIAFTATILGAVAIAFIIVIILGFFSFLEAAFGFCVACKIYPLLYQLFYHKQPVFRRTWLF